MRVTTSRLICLNQVLDVLFIYVVIFVSKNANSDMIWWKKSEIQLRFYHQGHLIII